MAAHHIATRLLRGEIAPGIYRIATAIQPGDLAADLSAHGWRVFQIDGKMVEDKAAFLREAGQAMRFPGYAGRNWDAFEELITDLSWVPAPGYVLIYDTVYRFVASQPVEWRTARAIFHAAVAEWQRQQIPFYVLLRKNWYANRDLPVLRDAPVGATP